MQDDTYGKALHFSSTDTDAFLAAPATGTLNYVWEATIVIGGNTNAFGLANNYYAALGKAHGATYISLYPNGNTWSQDAVKYRNGGTSVPFTQDCDPKKGDVIRMKIVSLNGNNYVYYNDTLVATAPSRAANIGIADSVQDDRPGFYTYAGDILVTDVKVSHAYAVAFDVTAGRVAVGDSGDVDLSFDLTFDTTQPAYRQHVTGAYTAAQEDAVRLGIVLYVGDTDVSASLTTATAGAECVTFPASTITEENGYLYATFLRASLPVAMLQKVFSIRPFVQIGDATFYSDGAAYVPAALANGAYISAQDASARARIEEVFGMYPEFRSGAGAKELTFTLFSDFHYKAGLYSTSIADLRSILARADSSNSAFILSGGDITNDMKGSPELYQTYLNYVRSDGSILPAYNIYGNHELESEGNTMALVTPTLTNDANVVWGTADGRPAEDGSIGYYYFESSGFRIVCLDTQYSYNPNHKDGVLIGWEHNLPNSYGCPSAARNATRGFDEGKDAAGNQYPNALGATQLS